MKKIITVLWVIIIFGAIIISIKLFKPQVTPEDNFNENLVETNPDIPEESSTNIENGTYTDYLSAGDKFFYNGEYDKAIENYLTAINLNPNSEELLKKLAESYLSNNEPEKALSTFEKLNVLLPNSIDIYLGIARSYLDMRNIENAKNTIWKLDSRNPEVSYYTGLILVLYKDFEGAKKIFSELINPENKVAEELRTKSQKFINAYTTYSYFTESPQVFLELLLAKAFTENQHYSPAIPLLLDVIQQKNNYRDAWLILGYAYLNTGKTKDAIDAMVKAKDLEPEKPETLFFLGLAYFADNKIDNAIFYIEEADKKGFEPKELIDLKLGDLYLLKKDFEKSAQSYQKVLAKNTSSLDVFVKAVWLNIDKLGNNGKALELALKALSIYPQNAMSFNLVGWAYTAQNNFSEAKKYLAKSLKMNPDFDAAFLNLGWLYEKKGSITTAKEYYKKAYFLGNGNATATLAATRFNKLSEQENSRFFQADITSPSNP